MVYITEGIVEVYVVPGEVICVEEADGLIAE
jgi:hypothetical protein